MRNLFFAFAVLFAMSTVFVSCSSDDETPAPVVEIYAEADTDDPYTYAFSAVAQYVDEYNWDFGDGNVSVEGAPKHTFEQSGTYTITLTAKGGGGEVIATKDIEILASIEELLSGGSALANGKTWKLSKVATTAYDGVGNVNADFLNDVMPGADNMLDVIGLPDEWDNEYTFVYDGNYSINNGNQNVLAGWIYSSYELGHDQIVNTTPYGVFQVKHTAPTNAKWSFNDQKDLVLDVANDDGQGGAIEESITLNPDKYLGYIEFQNGGFIGVQDYVSTAIIREITSERMVLTVIIYSNEAMITKPSILITVSFDAK